MGLFFALCAVAAAAVLGFGPGDGRVEFQLSSTLHEIEGEALGFAGQLDTAARTGTLTVDAGSLTTGLGPRDSRMLAWCLEAPRFPAITFALSSIEGGQTGLASGVGSGSLSLRGTLTIRDITQALVVPATFAWEGDKLRIKGRHDMKWTDWNLPDPSTVLSTVSPDMAILFDILARPA
ncbi:MAG: YceI family protein [Pseudomonadota bacterium]|nr:YceI family protein [Pseudomonadota bacterium]